MPQLARISARGSLIPANVDLLSPKVPSATVVDVLGQGDENLVGSASNVKIEAIQLNVSSEGIECW